MDEDDALHVLVVEDEMILAMELQARLEDMGHRVMGPVGSVRKALARLEKELPDAAILDVNVNGDRVTPVARALQAAQVPYALATGYTAPQLPEPELRDALRIGKPIEEGQLKTVIKNMRAAAGK